MRKRSSLDSTIKELESFLEDGNCLVCYVHVGTVMDAVEWLKELRKQDETEKATGESAKFICGFTGLPCRLPCTPRCQSRVRVKEEQSASI